MGKRVLVGHVSVDSGQVMICDPCYIDSTWDHKGNDKSLAFGEEVEKAAKDDFNYFAACKQTLSEAMAGQFWLAVAASSGYGDGQYPVYATYKAGRIKKLEIVFF